MSIWLDTLSRELLDTGAFADLVLDRHVTGATSNPTIFAKAITGSDRYESQLARLLKAGERDTRELFFALALDDVRRAADILAPVHTATSGTDGFVSFECTPDLANDTEATITQARSLWTRLQRPNTMIKVPATEAGVPAIERLTAAGHQRQCHTAVLHRPLPAGHRRLPAGLEACVARASPSDDIASVASFFVSRVDTKVDAQLPDHSPFRGHAAVANAALAFAAYRRTIGGHGGRQLAAAGAQPQRPLWASTGTKNDTYSDVLYVESLIAPESSTPCPRPRSTPSPITEQRPTPSPRPTTRAREMLDQLRNAGST